MSKKPTVSEWVRIAKMTTNDIEAQLACFSEEAIDEWETDRYDLYKAVDAFCDAWFVSEVLYSLGFDGYKDAEDIVSDRYEELFRIHKSLDIFKVTSCYERVKEANFKKFCTSPHLAMTSVPKLAERGIATEVVISEDDNGTPLYVIKSARDQMVKDKFYPKGKILKPAGWLEPNFNDILGDKK